MRARARAISQTERQSLDAFIFLNHASHAVDRPAGARGNVLVCKAAQRESGIAPRWTSGGIARKCHCTSLGNPEAPPKLRRGMPDEIPLLLSGRSAVDAGYQGRGLGVDLLIDALRRCLVAAETAGARGVITHAIDDAAVAFYERHGFARCPLGERTMLMPIESLLCARIRVNPKKRRVAEKPEIATYVE